MYVIAVDLEQNRIIIQSNGPSKLSPAQVSQLYYWGFSHITNDDQYILLSNKYEDILRRLISFFDSEHIAYSLSEKCASFLHKQRQNERDFENVKASAASFKDGNIHFNHFDEFTSFLRNKIDRHLKDHQVKAAYHLYLVRNGANFSVPGSGKTSVVLSAYEKLRLEGKVNLLFVVGPPSCFGPWKAEFELTLGRKPQYRILAGIEQSKRKLEYYTPSSDKAELYLTTYQSLLNDQNEVATFFMQQGIEVFLIIDEAHYIKQLDGSWANAALKVADYAKYRCVLTGTPLPRSYTDIFNLFDFLWPHNAPIDTETKIRIALDEEKGDEVSAKEKLRATVGPIFYRVRKSELGLMAPVFHPPHVVTMNKYERLIYDAIIKKIRTYSKEDYLKNIDLVNRLRRGRIIRLRQCVSYIKLLSTAVEDYKEDLLGGEKDLRSLIINYDRLEVPSKIQHLKEMAINLLDQNQKVLIWANFIGTLKLIRRSLSESGVRCKLIYGETPTENETLKDEETREKIVKEFVNNRSNLNVLIANPAACAESISLHKTCFHAIYYDLSYNCAQYLQSLDRIHRVGGSENNQANYYYLQHENSIDQDIKANLDNKARKMYEVIEEDYNIFSLDMFKSDGEIQAYKRLFGD